MSSKDIPKVIWQTHEWEYDSLPQNFKATTMTWKNLNPDWEYRYMSAKERADYVKVADPILYRIYLLSDNTSQADIWRYLVIYKNGGVYADMDSICTMPLTYMMEQHQNGAELVCTELDENNLVNNANFAAVRSSKTLEKVLKHLMSFFENVDYFTLLKYSKSKEEFWSHVTRTIKLTPDIYHDVVLKENSEFVSFNFIGAIHSLELKDKFTHDYLVNYYGKDRSYYDLAREHGWETYIL